MEVSISRTSWRTLAINLLAQFATIAPQCSPQAKRNFHEKHDHTLSLIKSHHRDQSLDVAKGIGIFAVVVGHSMTDKSHWVYTFLYAWHMPLFFMISGLAMRDDESLLMMARRRFADLVLPYVATVGILFLYWCAVTKPILGEATSHLAGAQHYLLMMVYGTGAATKYFPTIPGCGVLWFLPCLFLSLVFQWLLRSMFKTRQTLGLMVCVVVATCGQALGNLERLPWSMDLALLAQPFLWIARWLRHRDDRSTREWSVWAAMIGGFSICSAVSDFNMNSRAFSSLPLALLAGVCGSLIVIFASQRLVHSALGDGFRILGRYSLVILCFHSFDAGSFHFKELFGPWYGWLTETPLTWVAFRILSCGLIALLLSRFASTRLIYKLDPRPHRPNGNTEPLGVGT